MNGLRIRTANVVILLLSTGLSNFLVSTPTTSPAERLLASFVGAMMYVAGWRYWVMSTRYTVVRRLK